MSTKTNFKRIALVAVASLGLGVLSSVPSNAAIVGVPTVVTTNGTATLVRSDTTTAARIQVKFNATAANDSVNVTVSLGSKPSGAVGATDSVLASMRDTATSTGGAHQLGLTGTTAAAFNTSSESKTVSSNKQTIVAAAAGVVVGQFRYHLDTALVRTAGTYTLDYYVTVYSAGAEVSTSATFGQLTIVVTDGTDGTGNTAVAGTSTAVISSGTSYAPAVSGVDDVVTAASTPPGTEVANIRVTQKTAAGDPARESITVTTNIGNVGLNDDGASGKSVTFLATADGIDDINVYSDGSAGTATITIKTTSVTFAPKTVTFYSTTVAKYTITQLATVIGSSSANTFVVTALDAQNVVIKESTNSTVYAYSSNLDAVATAATSASGQACSAYSATAGGHVCALTGAANGEATITIRNKSTVALSTVSATAGKVTVNTNAPVKIALAFDKATYAPGEVAYLTVSATDAAGNPVAPNSTGYANMLATGGITSNVAFGNGSAGTDSMTATTLPFSTATSGKASTTGIYTVKVFMPASGGAIEAYVTGGTALAAANQVKLTAKATVTDSGAAALAAVNALATTVASLRTLITTLTNLVLKIQKKVKA